MRTSREDAFLLLDPVFRASSVSGRDGRRTSLPEALIVLPDPPRKLIRCFSGFYLHSRSYAIYIFHIGSVSNCRTLL